MPCSKNAFSAALKKTRGEGGYEGFEMTYEDAKAFLTHHSHVSSRIFRQHPQCKSFIVVAAREVLDAVNLQGEARSARFYFLACFFPSLKSHVSTRITEPRIVLASESRQDPTPYWKRGQYA